MFRPSRPALTRGRGTRPRRLPAIPFVLAAIATLAGCSNSSGPTVATLRSQGANPAPSATVSEAQANLAYAACMREHGIDMPDPLVKSDGTVSLQMPDNLDKRAFMTADESCRHFLAQAIPATTPNPNAAQDRDAYLAYARCMRSHGIDVPDPAGVGVSVVVPAGAGADEATATFQAADSACNYLLPGKPGASTSPGASAAAAPPAGATAQPSGVGQ